MFDEGYRYLHYACTKISFKRRYYTYNYLSLIKKSPDYYFYSFGY
jgi:hypothetical protein